MPPQKILLCPLLALAATLAVSTAAFSPPRAVATELPGDDAFSYRLDLLSEFELQQERDTVINPDNLLVPQYDRAFTAIIDLYMHWRPLTADLRVEKYSTDLERDTDSGRIRELYIDAPAGRDVQLSAGRKLFRWGTGYAFAPTGVLDPVKLAGDPEDRLQQYIGKDVVAFDYFGAESSTTLVYANSLHLDGGRLSDEEHELALRYYRLVGETNLSLIASWRELHKFRAGFNTSSLIGSQLEVHTEWIGKRGSRRRYHRSTSAGENALLPHGDPYEERYADSSSLYSSAVLGGQYTYGSGVSLLLEYYYNREGLSRGEWEKWRAYTRRQAAGLHQDPWDREAAENYSSALATLEDGNLTMRHYGFFRLFYPTARSGWEVLNLANLVDGSGVVIPSLSVYLRPHLKLWLRVPIYYGSEDSEFGTLFSETKVQTGLKISF